MKISIDGGIWQQIVKTAEVFLTELSINAREDGLYVSQQTAEKSTMIGVRIPKELCDTYELAAPRELIVNLEHLVQATKPLKGIDTVVIEAADGDNRLKISGNMNKRERRFEIPLLSPETASNVNRSEKDFSKMKFEVEIRITQGALKALLKDVRALGGRVRVRAASGKLSLFVDEGQRTAESTIEEGEELASMMFAEKVELAEAVYPIIVLGQMFDMVEDDKQSVIVSFANKKPLLLEVVFGDIGKVFAVTTPMKVA